MPIDLEHTYYIYGCVTSIKIGPREKNQSYSCRIALKWYAIPYFENFVLSYLIEAN